MKLNRGWPMIVLLVVLEAPLWILWGLLAFAIMGVRGVRALMSLRKAMVDVLVCPAGHANPVIGRWECRCGYVYLGAAFERCTNCSQVAGYFPCRRCQLGVRSPNA